MISRQQKLQKALEKAVDAFWNEIDGDTDLPSGFGIQVKGMARVHDDNTGRWRIHNGYDQSIGLELAKMMEEEQEGGGSE